HAVMEKKTPREVLADNLTRLMEHKKLSQHGLRTLSGVPQTTIGRIVRAEHGASVDLLEPIGKALVFEPWMLLYPELDVEGTPLLVKTQRKFSFSPGVMDRLLRLFDSLTAAHQETELQNMERLVGTNKDLVRELTKRSGFTRGLQIPQHSEPKPPPYHRKKK